ncbi:MAG: hypothetical protein ACKOPO_03770 [Novosphingobium sp.]
MQSNLNAHALAMLDGPFETPLWNSFLEMWRVQIQADVVTMPDPRCRNGLPDSLLGELVVSCIDSLPGTAISEETVRTFAQEQLASFKVPRKVLFFAEDELQTTGSAKIKAADLRKLAAERLKKEMQKH